MDGSVIRAALASVGAVGDQVFSLDDLAKGAADALRAAGPGLTPQGAAGFLATCAVESAYFRTTKEYGTGQRYAPYIGRTFIQVTWQENYAAFGAWCKAKGLVSDANHFVNNPSELSNIQWCWLGGVWFMERNGLWKYANAGNMLALSQGVNGGNGRIGTSFVPYGWPERKKMYDIFLKAGNALLPTPTEEEELMAAKDDIIAAINATNKKVDALSAKVDTIDGLISDPNLAYTVGDKKKTGSLRSIGGNTRTDVYAIKQALSALAKKSGVNDAKILAALDKIDDDDK